jgi:hypothetical protein
VPDGDILDSIADAKSLIRYRIKAPQEAGTPVSLNGAAKACVASRFVRVVSHGQAIGREPGIEDNIYNPPTREVRREVWRVSKGITTLTARETAAHNVSLLV